MNREDLIRKLDLKPLEPEGGYVNEYHQDELYSTIIYMLTPDSFSHMHKLEHDEVWFFHEGSPVEMLLIDDEHDEIRYLSNEDEVQIIVKAGTYIGARMKEKDRGYSLVSTCVIPPYSDEIFTLGSYEELSAKTVHKELLKQLT